ncbi:MAG: serine protease [Verrucomicrobiota bacterium]
MKRLAAVFGIGMFLAGRALAAPLIIDDEKLLNTLTHELGAMADADKATDGKTLAKASKAAPLRVAVKLPRDLPKPDGYAALTKSVFIIGTVIKCENCNHWHPAATATAWCLTADGLMVTNHHVFENAEGASWGVCSVDGNVFRVLEILATNKTEDVAVFRVDAKDLTPLAIGAAADVGDKVSIISHPDHQCYFRSSGEVARYVKAPQGDPQPGSIWMSVTADFAKGSSGGPILNADGTVVGMVSNTQFIFVDPANRDAKEQGPLQMVIKNCVPLSAICEITTGPTTAASRE